MSEDNVEIEKTWRDEIDDRNIQFRTELHRLFFRKFTPLIANEIGGIFNKIFKERLYDPCFRLNIDSSDDGTFKIDWEIPTTEHHVYECSRWHFTLTFKYEFKELFQDEIEKAFN